MSVPLGSEQAQLLYSRALDLLAEIVEEAHDAPQGERPVESAFVYRHANNIVWLATDVITLMREERISGPPILARVMLESLFNLGAAITVPNFAARKTVSELKDWVRRIQALNILDSGPSAEVTLLESQIAQLQIDYQVDPNDSRWTVARCIEAAPDVSFLRTSYFLLSQHTHSSSAGLSARHSGVDVGVINQTLIGCITIAVGFAAQLLPTENPQKYVDAASSLLQELNGMVSMGLFPDAQNSRPPSPVRST